MTSVQEKVGSSSEGHDTTATAKDTVEISRRIAIERRRRILEHGECSKPTATDEATQVSE
jgi:hypothetical protein